MGEPAAAWEELAHEFAGDARPLPTMAEHRPIGLVEGNDGSLYVSDDHGGRISRVVYTGD